MYKTELEEIKKYADTCNYVPVTRELMADITTPIRLLEKLKNRSRHCYLLESMEKQERWGRYTFIGFDPTLAITAVGDTVTIRDLKEQKTEIMEKADPIRVIRNILAEYKSPRIKGLPTFTGGLVGYFSYDFIKYSEPKLVLDAVDEENFKDIDLMLFDKVIVFDNLKQKIMLIVNVCLKNAEDSLKKAKEELEAMEKLILEGEVIPIPKAKLVGEFKTLFDKEQYMQMVEKAKKYIYEGDIFQVVLSNRLEAEMEGSLFQTYRNLRLMNPSPYMFYLSGDDIEVAGASPETLVKLEDGVLHTFPLAGTRPRGKDEEEDRKLEKELLADEKERAEHNMLVDLGRNDLGKISEYGSVKVEKYMEVERYSHVMHIGSTVQGQIKKEYDALDAIAAVLPAGTLSGAPKFRACQIINELENNKRGIYGGAIGYIDFAGNMDTCIGIRIAYKKNGKVFVRSGAGIVADSVPEKEYEECINKAAAVVKALRAAEEGK
ncbi:anthranilate synthase component I [Parasporobacterium paucivorans]|uniref:Anthranilate synthase component 1 n=1 Tax=Parasporobacterium paucivorans DSM 15970 TaxID=1122934 RepID=A0A1M6IFY0_9FIRM|nr:anthranilate synthase component I [Parasporobacterium paucivorans]SHJ33357.1 anthranilate synthase, component I [Parasporobacterium paucivorans DSM 15970]